MRSSPRYLQAIEVEGSCISLWLKDANFLETHLSLDKRVDSNEIYGPRGFAHLCLRRPQSIHSKLDPFQSPHNFGCRYWTALRSTPLTEGIPVQSFMTPHDFPVYGNDYSWLIFNKIPEEFRDFHLAQKHIPLTILLVRNSQSYGFCSFPYLPLSISPTGKIALLSCSMVSLERK